MMETLVEWNLPYWAHFWVGMGIGALGMLGIIAVFMINKDEYKPDCSNCEFNPYSDVHEIKPMLKAKVISGYFGMPLEAVIDETTQEEFNCMFEEAVKNAGDKLTMKDFNVMLQNQRGNLKC